MKKYLKQIPLLKKIVGRVKWEYTKFNWKYRPHFIPDNIYKRTFGSKINWKNPQNLIEKIYWLQIYSDTTIWTLCADKYRVREYVKQKGCSEILNTLYGRWESACDITWEDLPDSFVLKTNNYYGQVIVVEDKNKIDKEKVIRMLNEWIRKKYGYYDAQLHYSKIKPCIIAERFIENTDQPEKSLIDYKIWCFNGEPECILVITDRKDGRKLSLYDLYWKNISHSFIKPEVRNFKEIPKPLSLDKMMKISKKLSEGIPQVRIDFYEIEGKPIFGEMTFTAGYLNYKTEYFDYLGSQLNLKKSKKMARPNTPFN